jgi:hypothetical protein
VNEKADEAAVAKLLSVCGLRAERYSKRPGEKRPDFRVNGPAGELFICEVKSIRSTPDKPITYDRLYGAITDDLKIAVKQFEAVNSTHLVPNVLVWVTHKPRYNRRPFVDLLRGKIIVDGVEHGDLGKQRFGRFDRHLRCVDLFFWLFAWGKPELLYNNVDARHLQTLMRLLRDLPNQDCENAWGGKAEGSSAASVDRRCPPAV